MLNRPESDKRTGDLSAKGEDPARPDETAERAALLALGKKIYDKATSSLSNGRPLIIDRKAGAEGRYRANLDAIAHISDKDEPMEHMAFFQYLKTVLPEGVTAVLEGNTNPEIESAQKMTVGIEAGGTNPKVGNVTHVTVRIEEGGLVADLLASSNGNRKLVIYHAPSKPKTIESN